MSILNAINYGFTSLTASPSDSFASWWQGIRLASQDADGRFAAVGDNGTLLLSTDGTNWVSEEVGASDAFYGTSYYENGSFAIVGDNGVILFNQPPQLGQLFLLPDHTLQFSLNGLNGSTAIIEATPSLSPPAWQPVATNVINNGVVTFTDHTSSHALFYRARVQ